MTDLVTVVLAPNAAMYRDYCKLVGRKQTGDGLMYASTPKALQGRAFSDAIRLNGFEDRRGSRLIDELVRMGLEAAAAHGKRYRQGNSGDNEKTTPRAMFDFLNRRYQFTYDAFASHENALCGVYSTVDGTFDCSGSERIELLSGRGEHEDGLTHSWAGERVFFNPPYAHGLMAAACEKAIEERNSAEIIVGLIKWDTSTVISRTIERYCDVWPLKRVRFEGDTQPATFLNALIIPRPDLEMIPHK